MATDDIERLTRAANLVEATLWKQALEAEGIECRIVGDNLDAAAGEFPPGYMELCVRRTDLHTEFFVLGLHCSSNLCLKWLPHEPLAGL